MLEDIRESSVSPIQFDQIAERCSISQNHISACLGDLEKNLKQTETSKEKPHSKEPQEQDYCKFVRSYLHDLSETLRDLENLAGSRDAEPANTPALLLVGMQGTGKTHLFCDIAKHRVAEGYPTVLLLGQQFSNAEPWSQIILLSGLSADREQFLGALEAAAQATGVRALILIDALN
ncbi:MAG: ATP-binding protein [Armatimonadetes bacterium]|nr:ATP-binding protein [Armatimonadota bacterium]